MKSSLPNKRRNFTRDTSTHAAVQTEGVLSSKGIAALAALAVVLLTCSFWAPSSQDFAALLAQVADLWTTVSTKVHGLFAATPGPTPDVASISRIAQNTTLGPCGANAAFSSITGMLEGAFGKGIALCALLMGGAVSVARGTMFPAVAGVAQAAMISFMPAILTGMLGCTG